ncbi:MAG: exodeoxyribonuclease V subunit alpha [Lentisphaeria bacterium]|nr:exodeoxyribonuclease V subunit alpha [Lentisphaeria bacterium]
MNALQAAFGEMIGRRSDLKDNPLERPALELLAALALRATSAGHSCINLLEWKAQFVEKIKESKALSVSIETIEKWLNDWIKTCLSLHTNAISRDNAPDAKAPLVMELFNDMPMVFLRRFNDYEINIASRLGEIISNATPLIDASLQDVVKADIKKANKHFENMDFEEDFQQQAIFNTLLSEASIITGGPGRGKTTVLAAILALALKQDAMLKIAICAPTGKAAARMKQAIEKALTATLDTEFIGKETIDILANLKPRTVHSLLGIIQETDYPKANAENPLDYDLVAVDECSMLSLQMFSQLLSALKNGTRLILLGDENQLESVDSGEVLAALCKSLPKKCVNRLVVNYRSRDNQKLCDYTDKLVSSEAPEMTEEVDELYSTKGSVGKQGLFRGMEISGDKKCAIAKTLAEFLEFAGIPVAPAMQPAEIDDMFENLEKFKILCPIYDGAYGVTNMNSLMRKLLNKKGEYADGVPILVTRNDKVTGLLNGDIGVCKNGQIHFKTIDAFGKETIRHFSPAQLPEHTCAYAMSIHKSQGSDYDNVLMTLPANNSIFLTKKLIYTGMTRTKKNFMVLADKETLATAQIRNDHRWSRLGPRISATLSRQL